MCLLAEFESLVRWRATECRFVCGGDYLIYADVADPVCKAKLFPPQCSWGFPDRRANCLVESGSSYIGCTVKDRLTEK